MTFTQFTAFAALAKHLNVTKAANMLHVSQPSLSKHLKALEENFRLRLFTRHPKGIRLTDDGYEFFMTSSRSWPSSIRSITAISTAPRKSKAVC